MERYVWEYNHFQLLVPNSALSGSQSQKESPHRINNQRRKVAQGSISMYCNYYLGNLLDYQIRHYKEGSNKYSTNCYSIIDFFVFFMHSQCGIP